MAQNKLDPGVPGTPDNEIGMAAGCGAAVAYSDAHSDAHWGETPQRILDVAEHLFVEKGFASTSLRAITGAAGVNLAAVHYHFGSKQALFEAVISRRIAPLNRRRFEALAELQKAVKNPDVRSVLEAFFAPFLEGNLPPHLPRLMARVFAEPPGRSRILLESQFGALFRTFVDALATALPGVEREDLEWHLHFVVGSMIHIVTVEAPFSDSALAMTIEDRIQKLINFAVAGMLNQPAKEKA